LNLSVPLTVTDCTFTVNGSLTTTGIELVNAQLIVNGDLKLTGTASVISVGSALTVNGDCTASSGELTLGGTMEIHADLALGNATLTGGTLTLGGDLTGTGEVSVDTLILNGRIRQRMDASSLRTGDLILKNISKGGVLLVQELSYSGTYSPGTTPLFNESMLMEETENETD
jgi:hypothetical protein